MSNVKSHNPETVAVHVGREPDSNFGIVNPPVYHASTILFKTYDDFLEAEDARRKGPVYGRHGTETHRLLENIIAALEGAEKCLLTSSGLNAISTTLLALLNPGDHLLMVDSVYAPTRFLCEQELKRFGIEVDYYDPMIGAGIAKLIKSNTKVIYTESPGSLTFEVQDIPAIVAAAKKSGIMTVIDNTWATPLYFNALAHGVDVSIHSATKYMSGHSDLIMGVINTSEKIYQLIKRSYKNLGICPGPDDVYLAQRGIRTMPTRLKVHQQSALDIAHWLKKHPLISRVLHPALPDCPGHEIWKRDFTGASGLFAFVLKRHLNADEHAIFLNDLELFKMGYSWGGFESLIIPVMVSKIRTVHKFQPEGSAFRIFTGLENVEDLRADLAAGLERIS